MLENEIFSLFKFTVTGNFLKSTAVVNWSEEDD
jgi:hypothetical protein